MDLESFIESLCSTKCEDELARFTRETLLHGNPHVFDGREADYFRFKERISKHFEIHHTEIFLVGSGKLGFSPLKRTEFTLDSDIDLAIVAPDLWERVYALGIEVEYARRSSHIYFHIDQLSRYQRYLQYMAIGWVRPDLMPNFRDMKGFKQDWFDFFQSLSFDQSEIGNYKVTAGIFRGHQYLERYSVDSMRQIRENAKIQQRVQR